jgi:hypothetical protein
MGILAGTGLRSENISLKNKQIVLHATRRPCIKLVCIDLAAVPAAVALHCPHADRDIMNMF